MAAITLIIVGMFFVPTFLENTPSTRMPEFLEKRHSPTVRTVMAVFWLGLHVFVNLTSILWLGATAVGPGRLFDAELQRVRRHAGPDPHRLVRDLVVTVGTNALRRKLGDRRRKPPPVDGRTLKSRASECTPRGAGGHSNPPANTSSPA